MSGGGSATPDSARKDGAYRLRQDMMGWSEALDRLSAWSCLFLPNSGWSNRHGTMSLPWSEIHYTVQPSLRPATSHQIGDAVWLSHSSAGNLAESPRSMGNG